MPKRPSPVCCRWRPRARRSTSRTCATSSVSCARAGSRKFRSLQATWCASRPRASPSRPRRSASAHIWMPSSKTRSRSASAPPAPARPTSPWRRRSRRFVPSASTASSSRVRRLRRASGWAFCPATCRTRSTPTCARCTTRSLKCSARTPTRSISSAVTLRSRRWRTCAAARSTTASSSSTRRRTPPASR